MVALIGTNVGLDGSSHVHDGAAARGAQGSIHVNVYIGAAANRGDMVPFAVSHCRERGQVGLVCAVIDVEVERPTGIDRKLIFAKEARAAAVTLLGDDLRGWRRGVDPGFNGEVRGAIQGSRRAAINKGA